MRKKMILALVLAMTLIAGLLSGCGRESGSDNGNDNGSESGTNKKSDKYSVVCTIFPEYDWVKEIIGENSDKFNMTLLLDNGVDLHSYQPTAEDILTISTCDLFIYVGGESDSWVKDALKESVNKDMKVINLLEVLGDNVKEEEVVEGMEEEEEEEDEEDEDEIEYDEHVWLSLKNAEILVDSISNAIQEIDEDNKEIYVKNTDSYISDLDELDQEYQSVVEDAQKDTILFGDRFPFRYLTDDYGLKYYAAFVGCSAETEASFETVIFLAGKIDELSLKNIFVIENSDKKIAQTIISNTTEKDQAILVLDSMQSTTKKDIDSGTTYLSVMRKNLEVLKEALD